MESFHCSVGIENEAGVFVVGVKLLEQHYRFKING